MGWEMMVVVDDLYMAGFQSENCPGHARSDTPRNRKECVYVVQQRMDRCATKQVSHTELIKRDQCLCPFPLT